MSSDGDAAVSSQMNGSQSPYSAPLDSSQSVVTPGSSGGSSTLPGQLPRSLTRSASSLVPEAGQSGLRSTGASPARMSTSSSQQGRDSRASSLSRSRPSFSESMSPNSSLASPAGILSPPLHSPVFEETEDDPTQSQPRSFEKMQESMLSDTSTASGIVDKISLLPDETVCVGLSMQQEYIWRAKIIHALFYIEDVLPPKMVEDGSGAVKETDGNGQDSPEDDQLDSRGTSRQSHLHLYSTTPTPQRPALGFESRNTPVRSFSASTQESRSQSLFNATEDAEYPVSTLLSRCHPRIP